MPNTVLLAKELNLPETLLLCLMSASKASENQELEYLNYKLLDALVTLFVPTLSISNVSFNNALLLNRETCPTKAFI